MKNLEDYFELNPSIKYFLYTNVRNVSEILKEIIAQKLDISIINPQLIVNEFVLKIGILNTMRNVKNSTMATNSFSSELIHSLSPHKSITESMRTFNSASLETLLFVGNEDHFSKLALMIQGEKLDLNQLASFTSPQLIAQTYQISEKELQFSSLSQAVITKMSIKEFL